MYLRFFYDNLNQINEKGADRNFADFNIGITQYAY
jgi:hypothetical protein